jgi:hypothetical protein
MIKLGTEVESHGYTFVYLGSQIDVYDYERDIFKPVAIIPTLYDNGNRRVNSQEDLEIEVAYWLKDWIGV